MASLPYALSVHHFISSVGADAGFASLIGLALLVLLYFAHARETATLRSRADEAGFRVQELEAQVADLADQVAAMPAEISVRAAGPRVAAASGGVARRVAGAPGAGRGGLLPAAPAGMAGPALASATRLIPMPEAPAAEPEGDTAMVAGGNGSSRVPVAAGAGTIQRPVQAPAGAPPRGPGGPGRAGGGGSGRVGPITGQPRPTGGQPRPGTGRPGGPSSPGGGRTGMPMRPAPRRSRSGRTIAAILVAALGVAAVIAAVLVLTGKGGSSTASKSSAASVGASSLTSRRTARSVAVVPSTVTVSVLNGTDLSGLAARVATKLQGEGYRKGAVTNAATQTETTSTVAYLTPVYKPDAVAVATALKLTSSAVQAVDPGTKSLACSNAAVGCNSPVYVTVGSDLSSQ